MRHGFSGIVALCVGCGGGVAPAALDGSIAGEAMVPRDAVSSVVSFGSGSAEGLVLITESPDTCGRLKAKQRTRNDKRILIGLGNQTGKSTSAPAAAGTWTIHNATDLIDARGNVAVAIYATTDANCAPLGMQQATSGSVTLSGVDAGRFTGSFDLTLGDGSHVTGHFEANPCAALTLDDQGTCG